MKGIKKLVCCLKSNWLFASSLTAFDKPKSFLPFLAALVMLLAQGCGNESHLESFLLKEQEIGTVVQLSSLYDKKMDWVCLLGPYTHRLHHKYDSPQHHAINNFLQKINYVGKEHLWSLVFAKDDTFDIVTFKRSKTSDIDQGPTAWVSNLPKNFETATCTNFEHAAMFKTDYHNKKWNEYRIYFVFGRLK